MPDAPASREMRIALQALECCTLEELAAIELYHLRHLKWTVAERTAKARSAAPERISLAIRPPEALDVLAPVEWTPALEAEALAQGADVPFVVDGALVPDDDDTDEVNDPTEIVPVNADPGQWAETHDGPVS